MSEKDLKPDVSGPVDLQSETPEFKAFWEMMKMRYGDSGIPRYFYARKAWYAALMYANVVIRNDPAYQPDRPTPPAEVPDSVRRDAQEKIKAMVLDEQKKGNVALANIEGLRSVPLKELVAQPAMGILYDLNRLPEVVLTFIGDPKWINDFACAQVIAELKRQVETAHPAPAVGMGSIPMLLHCPSCSERHVDAGKFATKPHHTHACQSCGMVWRPAIENTVGVQFLPGFKDSVFADERGESDPCAASLPSQPGAQGGLTPTQVEALREMANLWHGSLFDEDHGWPDDKYKQTYRTVIDLVGPPPPSAPQGAE